MGKVAPFMFARARAACEQRRGCLASRCLIYDIDSTWSRIETDPYIRLYLWDIDSAWSRIETDRRMTRSQRLNHRLIKHSVMAAIDVLAY